MTAHMLTPPALAKLLGVDRKTICNWVMSGYLPANAVTRYGRSTRGKRIRISVARLREAGWLDAAAAQAPVSVTYTPGA